MAALFGGLIASVLLGLYVYAVVVAVIIVRCAPGSGCTPQDFTDGMALVLSLVGGLVSALVIAELAVTKPGQALGARALPATAKAGAAGKVVTILTAAYLLVWLATGLTAFVVGTMQHPGVLQPLTDMGQAWLGLAVAAVYAYFGIDP